MTLHLANLDCASCGSALAAGPRDILFLCTHCGAGGLLGENGIEKLEAKALLPRPGVPAHRWKPAWSITADVVVADRVQFGGRETPGWSGRNRFVIPAFPLPLPDLALLAGSLSAASHELTEVPREPCTGGTLHLHDAETFIRHLVVGGEVRKRDQLAAVRVEVEPVSHHLTAVPFHIDGQHLVCSVTGTKVREATT